MSQRKEPGRHSGGRVKSEQRLRQKLVGVRLSPAEFEILQRASEDTGRSHSSLLRDAFLASYGMTETAP